MENKKSPLQTEFSQVGGERPFCEPQRYNVGVHDEPVHPNLQVYYFLPVALFNCLLQR